VTVLLMEGAMSFLLVPVFVAEVARAGSVSRIVRATLLPLLALLTVLTAVTLMAAPLLIDLLAPGIAERSLAIDCFRVATSTVLFMGVSGYLMAALRANHRFLPPASTYIAYNVGILTTMYALHHQLGVLSAALGLAVGSALMVAVQVRGFLQVTSLTGLSIAINRRLVLAAATFVPIAAYSLGRQGQVLVERMVGSLLDPGSISYVNYASKVAQVPMIVALTVATVAFPSLARIAADPVAMREYVDRLLGRIVLLILPATAFLVLSAEPCVELLFEHGAFAAADTEATAGVMRIYSLGLLGQVLVGLGTVVCFSPRKGSWVPAFGVIGGLVVTIVLDVSLMGSLGVNALAVGNAGGITTSAVLIMLGIRRRITAFSAMGLIRLLLIALPLAFAAAAAGWSLGRLFSDALVEVSVSGLVTVALFLLLTVGAGLQESQDLARAVRDRCGRAAGSVLRFRR
jgi:putative peptidoglycan lipid II flippase